jgi:hypothetical protein
MTAIETTERQKSPLFAGREAEIAALKQSHAACGRLDPTNVEPVSWPIVRNQNILA